MSECAFLFRGVLKSTKVQNLDAIALHATTDYTDALLV